MAWRRSALNPYLATSPARYPNFSFSNSSAAKALTTRCPARFSCSTVLMWPISVRSANQLRRIVSMMVEVRRMMKGTNTRLMRASFQL